MTEAQGPQGLQENMEKIESRFRGPKGDKGSPGAQGVAGSPGLSRNARLAIAGLLFLVLVGWAGSLLATYLQNQSFQAGQRQEQAQQRREGEVIEHKLCTSFAELAANKPPAGNPVTNPSRAYDQKTHEILSGIGRDIGCH